MKEVAVILMSHGYYAAEALKSAEMIIGEQSNVAAVSVTPQKDLDQVKKETYAVFDTIDTSNGVVVLTDILGGTPSNVAGNFVLTRDDTLAIAGFNLPMLLELFVDREKTLDEVKATLKESYDNSFNCLNDILSKEEIEDEHTIS